MKGADNGWIASGEHAQDAALGAAVFLLAAEFDQHLIAVHGRADGGRRDEDVAFDRGALIGIGDDKAVAVAMHGEAAGDEVLASGGVGGEGVTVAAGLDEVGALHQRAQAFGELVDALAPRRAISRTSCLYPAEWCGWRSMCWSMAWSVSMFSGQLPVASGQLAESELKR